MISFNSLGSLGRLGNQMFQYAALKGIAHNKQYWYSIPGSNFILKEAFNIPNTLPNFNKKIIDKTNIFEFDQDFFNNCPDDVDIVGFFQTEKYFKHIEQEIRTNFIFKDSVQKMCTNFLSKIPEEKIALHIRRNDYLELNDYFVNLDFEYYANSLELLDKNLPVIVYSDDINWCTKQKFFKNKRFIFSSLSDTILDLCSITMCNYHVIANSSFSWWGAWLAHSKKTIAPKQWFTGYYKEWNTKDLYLSNWVVI